MRHFRAASAVTPLTCGVGVTATGARLIAPPGFTHGTDPRMLRTAAAAVALAAVAGAAAEDRCAAAGAEVASSRGFHR